MKNRLFYGDNYEVLQQHIKDESIDLCYIDPPFNSKRNYNQIYNNIGTEDKAQAQAFVDTWTWNDRANEGLENIVSNRNRIFTKQSINLILGLEKVLGKGSLLAYLISMTERIAEIWRVLKPTGSFYLHCDPTASHYLKLVCDALFASRGGDFRNEIIWGYVAPSGAKKDFPKKHDTIFRYAKSDKYIFNPNSIRIPYSEAFLNRRKYSEGKAGIYKNRSDGRNEDDLSDNFSKGKLPPSWWTDIKSGGQMPRGEHLCYPTQKPLALLERILLASSNEGDTVLDAYCGCGTTIIASHKLNRNWIGIDITYQSISLIIKRLEDTFGKENIEVNKSKQTENTSIEQIQLSGVPQDIEGAVALANKEDDRLRKEFEKWAVLTYSNNRAIINEKKGGDGGIDGTVFILDSNNENNQIYQQVLFSVKSNKTLSPSVIRDLNGTLERENAIMGYLITLYPMDNLTKESKKYGTYTNKITGLTYSKIEVITIQQILDGMRLSLPLSLEVVKSALRNWNYDVRQTELNLEE